MKVPLIALSAFLAAGNIAAEESGSTAPSPKPSPAASFPSGSLYDIGRRLFDEYAPDEIKADYEFVSPEAWNAFLGKLQSALQSQSLEELADLAPAARAALDMLEATAQGSDLMDWLSERVDLADAAGQAARESLTPPPPVAPDLAIPHYDLWKTRLSSRPVPARAAALIPGLKAAFAKEGIPPALVWIAEVESSFNPNARSPVGAKGLFQLMPATAESLGLSTYLPDERTNPAKSAQAAARYLKKLHDRFGDWPLAIAAYNAGEGRVGRTLGSRSPRTFAAISRDLPSETQLYVPKVLATVALREGISPSQLHSPRPRS